MKCVLNMDNFILHITILQNEMNIFKKLKGKRTTLVGIEIAEKSEQKFIVDEVTFNRSRGVPDKQIDLTKDMNEEELTKYVEREWNRGKYQAGKK